MQVKKKITLLGGLGVIGRILTPALSSVYSVVVSDLQRDPPNLNCQYVQADVSDFSQLICSIPEDTDVIVNLTALPEKPDIVDDRDFYSMSELYIRGAYNVFLAAAKLQIKKVIFASSNRVTGYYEKNGVSLLGREINSRDYPFPGNVYGAMKSCAEQFGHLFSTRYGMSVICLRIGTVAEREYDLILTNDRARISILTHEDTVSIFAAAIESNVEYGIYYAVSDNTGRPWSIQEAIDDLGYTPTINSDKILKCGR